MHERRCVKSDWTVNDEIRRNDRRAKQIGPKE